MQEKTRKTRVLFLCTQNSARSQMAEGLLRHLAEDPALRRTAQEWRRASGLEALSIVSELGANVFGQESKSLKR